MERHPLTLDHPARRGRALGLVRWVFLVVPGVFLAGGVWFAWWVWSDIAVSERLIGRVVSVEASRSDGSTTYVPHFRYSGTDGASREATTYYGSSGYGFARGEQVLIYVNPARADRARVDSPLEIYVLPGVVIGFSLILMSGGFWAMSQSAPARRPRPGGARARSERYRPPKTRPSRPAKAQKPAMADKSVPPPRTDLPRRDGPTVRRG